MSYPELAACTSQPRLFFGPEGEGIAARRIRERHAKTICWDCPVRTECLADAITRNIPWGVWGGMGEKDRERYMGRLRTVGR
jgi:WhiB family transcriptional regulator, redox-sensing transcriptional regulator